MVIYGVFSCFSYQFFKIVFVLKMIFLRLIGVNGICLTLSELDIYNYFVFSKLFLLLIAETTFLSIYNQKVKSIRKNRLWVLTSSVLKRR